MEKPKEIRTNLGDIPRLVLVDIFRRLPIATILQCRRVCKSWNYCISSLDFSNAYQSQYPYPSLIDCDLFPEYNLLEFIDEYLSPKKLKIPPQLSGEKTRLVGSCNGFMCFVKCTKPYCKCNGVVDIFVGNPILGEYCLLSRPMFKKVVDKIQYETYGFGICLTTGNFMVLRMIALERRNKEFAEIQILTIGVDVDWRVLNFKTPIPKARRESIYSMGYRHRANDFIYFDGAIYWLYEDDGTLDFIYSFDFSEECVRLLLPPPGFKDNNGEKTLAVFKNCLCLVMLDWSHVAIWSIKPYGISKPNLLLVHLAWA